MKFKTNTSCASIFVQEVPRIKLSKFVHGPWRQWMNQFRRIQPGRVVCGEEAGLIVHVDKNEIRNR